MRDAASGLMPPRSLTTRPTRTRTLSQPDRLAVYEGGEGRRHGRASRPATAPVCYTARGHKPLRVRLPLLPLFDKRVCPEPGGTAAVFQTVQGEFDSRRAL